MGLLNYSTSIGVYKTLSEIQQILVEHGARKILCDYNDNGQIMSLSFVILTPNGEKGIRLPANVAAIFEVLKQQRKSGKIKTNPDYDQAQRVAWRIIKDWIDAQMAILESQMVKIEEIFLPYMINNKGETFFQAYEQQQLSSGNDFLKGDDLIDRY
jgi:hypothetical protein